MNNDGISINTHGSTYLGDVELKSVPDIVPDEVKNVVVTNGDKKSLKMIDGICVVNKLVDSGKLESGGIDSNMLKNIRNTCALGVTLMCGSQPSDSLDEETCKKLHSIGLFLLMCMVIIMFLLMFACITNDAK